MKIIYLGNFYSPKAYEELLALSQSQLNPSGQNFHALLAKALALNFETSVISFVPPPSVEEKTQNPTYHYLGEEKNGFSLIKKSLQKVLEIKIIEIKNLYLDSMEETDPPHIAETASPLSSGNDRQNGANPHEYRLFCPSLWLLILD